MSKKNNLRKLVYSATITIAVILFLLYQNSLEKEDTSAEVLNIVENPVSKYTQCRSDADCAKVPDGPCPCSSSGKAIAINKRYARRYEVLNKEQYTTMGCLGSISQHPTCINPVKCVAGYCAIPVNQ